MIFYGLRQSPDDDAQVLFVANMEGAPADVTPLALPIADLPQQGWRVAVLTPGLKLAAPDRPVTLHDSQGMLLIRQGYPPARAKTHPANP